MHSLSHTYPLCHIHVIFVTSRYSWSHACPLCHIHVLQYILCRIHVLFVTIIYSLSQSDTLCLKTKLPTRLYDCNYLVIRHVIDARTNRIIRQSLESVQSSWRRHLHSHRQYIPCQHLLVSPIPHQWCVASSVLRSARPQNRKLK